jgi:hypothetical protein
LPNYFIDCLFGGFANDRRKRQPQPLHLAAERGVLNPKLVVFLVEKRAQRLFLVWLISVDFHGFVCLLSPTATRRRVVSLIPRSGDISCSIDASGHAGWPADRKPKNIVEWHFLLSRNEKSHRRA